MIIFGSRSYFRSNAVTSHGFCGLCDSWGKLKSFDAIRCGHLYFIPLLPLEQRRRTHKLCARCDQGYAFPLPDYQNLLTDLKKRSASAMLALFDDQTTFDSDDAEGEPQECVPALLAVVDWLYAAGDSQYCLQIIEKLKATEQRYATEMLSAALATMQNDLDQAIRHYETAAAADREQWQPHAQAGHLLVVKKQRDSAIQCYQNALRVAKEDAERVAIYFQMVEQQMAGKQFAAAVESYEAILEIHPEVGQDKAFTKQLNKARKKAGM